MPRSLRVGGISVAYAVGVPFERIMRLSNHVSTSVVLRHYLDPLLLETAAARVFFSQFLPRRMLPGPVLPISAYLALVLRRAPLPSQALRVRICENSVTCLLLAAPPAATQFRPAVLVLHSRVLQPLPPPYPLFFPNVPSVSALGCRCYFHSHPLLFFCTRTPFFPFVQGLPGPLCSRRPYFTCVLKLRLLALQQCRPPVLHMRFPRFRGRHLARKP